MKVPIGHYQSALFGTARTWVVAARWSAVALLAIACRKEAPPKGETPPGPPPAPSEDPAPQRARCTKDPTPVSGVLSADRAPPPASSADAEEEARILLPFAPEVGSAVRLSAGAFAVGALEPRKSEIRAVALLLQRTGIQKRVDLGSVHGDPSPPALAARGDVVMAAVPTGAPSGMLLRLCRIDDIEKAPRVRWGSEVAAGADESDAFSLEVGESHTVVAWDDWDAKAKHSRVLSVSLEASDPAKPTPKSSLSADGEDAEAPIVVARPGGFFAAWITNVRRGPSPAERKERTEEEPPVELGPRFITVRRLDARGAPAGLAVEATPRDGHVVGFDLVAHADGSALLAYREDRAAPGLSGGALFTVVVRAGGSIEPRRVETSELGAAAPQLLVEREGPSSGVTWLSVGGDGDATLLATLDAEGRVEAPFLAEPVLDGAALLSASEGTLLLASPRGRGLEFSSARCASGALPSATATPSPP